MKDPVAPEIPPGAKIVFLKIEFPETSNGYSGGIETGRSEIEILLKSLQISSRKRLT